MPDKSINSLFGMLVTKELPASGIFKATNNSKQENHENNSFLAKLVDSMKNADTVDGLVTTAIPSESNNITETDDINHIIKLLSMGLQTNLTANSDDNQLPLNQAVNQNIPGNEFANIIINNSANGKTSTGRTETNTLLENALLNNQELNPLDGSNVNILRNPQKTAGEPTPEQTAPSFSGKLNTTQNDTKINEQRILDIINRPGLSEGAAESTGNESVLELSKLPDRQALESQKESVTSSLNVRSDINKDIVKEQTTTNISGNQNSVPAIEKAGSNPIPDAYKITDNKIINPNTSPHTEENAKDIIHEI